MNTSLESSLLVLSKPSVVIPYKSEPSWIGRHIRWLRKAHTGWGGFAINTLKSVEMSLLIVSQFVFPSIRKEFNREIENKFFKEKQATRRPLDARIEVQTRTRTFNHLYDFAIEDGVIWYRPRHKGEWKPVYFEAYANGKIPCMIDVDGANLIILDEDNIVYYRKIIREYHAHELGTNKKAQAKIQGHFIIPTQHPYIAINKIAKNNWKRQWFTLPVIHLIFHCFYSKHLQLPKACKAVAISHRGRYNNYCEDGAGQRHAIGVGVTTLHALDEGKKDLLKYDPWSPPHIRMTIPLPETSKMAFEGVNIDDSASTIMVIGYEIRKNEKGDGVVKALTIKTRLTDMDYEGWNPGLKYDYFKNPYDKDVFVIPLPDWSQTHPQWKDHPLILQDGSVIQNLTENIAINQTGEGNGARLMVIETIRDNKKSYYQKYVNEKYWKPIQNQDDDSFSIEGKTLYSSIYAPHEVFETTVHCYKAKNIQLTSLSGAVIYARLNEFGERAYESILQLVINDQPFDLRIHRRKSLKNFLGFKGDSYYLVIPEQYQNEEILMRAFGKRKVISLHIAKNLENEITLTPLFSWSKFKFIFKLIQNKRMF
jgi:hypothetical protein